MKAQGLNYIIVDDCSSDEFKDELDTFGEVIYLDRNLGTYGAFWEGLITIQTPYTMRVDSDDYLTGVPPIHGDYDAYVNNIHNKVTLDINDFLKKPFAGLNGIVVKTDILKQAWYKDTRTYGDVVIFARLIHNYNCVMNDVCVYEYTPRKGNNITNISMKKQKNLIKARVKLIKVEMLEPQTVQIEVTTKCNMKCFYCPIEDIDNKNMTFKIFKSIVDSYSRKVTFILQGTGEPTLHPRLLDMVKYIRETTDSKITTITNGKKRMSDELIQSFDRLAFSVDINEAEDEREVKELVKIADNILYASKLNDKVQVNLVDYGQDYEAVKVFCFENKIHLHTQDINTNEVYQAKYSTDKKVDNKLMCSFIKNKQMDYHFENGQVAPCCLMLKKEVAISRANVEFSFKLGIVPDCCKGCRML